VGRWAQRSRRGGGTSYRPIIIERAFLVLDDSGEVVVEFSAPVDEADFTPNLFVDLNGEWFATDVNQESATSLRYGFVGHEGDVQVGDAWEYRDTVTGIPQPQSGVIGPNV
jgi:hypothetical protein